MIKLKTLAQMTVVAATIAASNAYAVSPGAYVGGSLGWGRIDDFKFNRFGYTSADSGIAGRLFAGYQIDQNFGAEIGWDKFSDATIKGRGRTLDYKTYAVDLTGKATAQIGNGFSLYGKLGAAYLNQSVHTTSRNGSEGAILPTFGVGVGYDVTSNTVADISWNRIQKVGNSNLRSTDLFSVGLSYYFA